MEDKPVCPFCGAKTAQESEDGELYFDCLTIEYIDELDNKSYDRAVPCYERQLATLQAQVEGMREVVRKDLFLTGKLPNEPKHYECRWCKQWAFSAESINHEEDCIFFLLSATPAALTGEEE